MPVQPGSEHVTSTRHHPSTSSSDNSDVCHLKTDRVFFDTSVQDRRNDKWRFLSVRSRVLISLAKASITCQDVQTCSTENISENIPAQVCQDVPEKKNNAKPFQGAQFSTIAKPWIESNAKQLRRRFVIVQRRVAQDGVPGERNAVRRNAVSTRRHRIVFFRSSECMSTDERRYFSLQNHCVRSYITDKAMKRQFFVAAHVRNWAIV